MATGNVLDLSKVRRANPGDKKGWPVRSGQLPPDLAARFDAVTAGMLQTDAVCLAITEYVERHAPAASLPLAA